MEGEEEVDGESSQDSRKVQEWEKGGRRTHSEDDDQIRLSHLEEGDPQYPREIQADRKNKGEGTTDWTDQIPDSSEENWTEVGYGTKDKVLVAPRKNPRAWNQLPLTERRYETDAGKETKRSGNA